MAPDLNQIQPNTRRLRQPRRARRALTRTGGASTRATTAASPTTTTSPSSCRGGCSRPCSYEATYKWAHCSTRTSRGRGERSQRLPRRDQRPHRSTASTATTRAGRCSPIPDHRVIATVIWDLPFLRENRAPRRLDGIGHHQLRRPARTSPPTTRATAARARTANGPRRPTRSRGRTRTTGRAPPTSGSTPRPSPPRRSSTPQGRPIFAGRFGNAGNGTIDGPGLVLRSRCSSRTSPSPAT